MKTCEQLAGEIDRCYATMAYPGPTVTALIRADREEVLRRVENCGTTMTIEYGNGQKVRHILINPDKLATVKKEVCG